MRCMACGGSESSVIETNAYYGGRVVVRRRECECGNRWTTEEKTRAGSNTLLVGSKTAKHTPVIPPKNHANEPKDTPQIPPAPPTNTAGGVGGGLPSGLVSESGLGSSGPSKPNNRSRRSMSRQPPAYTPEFEAMWGATDKIGSKSDALDAWMQVGSPPASVIGPAWTAWMAFWNGIGIKHVPTWLRAYDWQQQPSRAPAPRPQPIAPPVRIAPSPTATDRHLAELATCSYHREIPDRPSSEYVDWCRTCKRLGLRQPRREGDREPMPLWMEGK